MALEIGSRLGHYEVAALIGEGGMGQVYQATDTTLNRQVALKILPEAFASDPDRLARFEREAQVLASLNHPGIAAIYGIEEANDTRALVLELVEGPTLADRIAEGPIPVDEALPIAKQIAEALEAAHEQGVIHRDLKPANIKLKPDGTVKVLDFGLAKAFDSAPDGDPSQSPTLTAAATQMGVIMGTAAYMSPEQAAGEGTDKRSDIWSFGVVVLEMITGRRLFDGKTVSHVLASVLKTDPEWHALPSDTPASLARLLRRCLEKEAKRRLRDMVAAAIQLEESMAEPAETRTLGAASSPSAGFGWPTMWLVGVAALAVGVLTTNLVTRSLSVSEAPALVRFSMAPDAGEALHLALSSPDIAISPNSTYVAYLTGPVGFGAERLHVRPLDQLASETLVAQGELNSPFFSPDGQSLGFYDRAGDGNVLQRVSVLGGPVSTICELPADMRGASWGADGTIVFAAGNTGGLWRVAAVGGEAEPLSTPDPDQGEIAHLWPHFLPGGESVLFTILADPIEESEIAVLSLATGEHRTVLQGGSFPRYSSTGHLLYVVQGNLWAVRFDPDRLEAVGAPVPVQENVLTKANQGAGNFDLATDGTLVFVPGGVLTATGTSSLVWVNRDGVEEAVAAPPAPYESPRVSPDGRYLAVEVRNPGNTDVMVYDLHRETLTRLTFEPGVDANPLWSTDGRRVVFSSDRDGVTTLYSQAADGTGQAERLTPSDLELMPQSFTPDGQILVAMTLTGDLVQVSLGDGGRAEALTQTDFQEFYPELSPDGRWIAYSSNESGANQVYVRPFPNLEDGRWQISRDGGYAPVWSADGREIFFRSSNLLDVMAVPVDTDPTFSPGNPAVLFRAPYLFGTPTRNRPWDVASDGRFVMIRAQGAGEVLPDRINVVLNWDRELRERVPVL